jgi:hypothetical protein
MVLNTDAHASWNNFGLDAAHNTDTIEVEKVRTCPPSAEYVDLVPVRFRANIVSWYDEPELHILRYLDDNGANSLDKVTPTNDKLGIGLRVHGYASRSRPFACPRSELLIYEWLAHCKGASREGT